MALPDASPPGGRGRALAVAGALLDRSLVQIADASADARRFDRQLIHEVTAVWDNNTFPLFRAAAADTPGEREQRARAALEWMAGLGAWRRSWMAEQAAAAGCPIDGLLPAAEPSPPVRDHLGRVVAPESPVTPALAAGLAADYDLASAAVRYLRVERAGTRLTGLLELAVARAYPTEDDGHREPALLKMWLDDVDEFAFDSQDARGAALRPTDTGVSVGVGAHGMLHAATAVLRPGDSHWHLSAAGRRADALTPPRDAEGRPRPHPEEGPLPTGAEAAARVLRYAMWEIRTVRYPDYVGRVPIRDFCRAFDGAGTAILAAGDEPDRDRREAAFRELVGTWARRGGPALARWFAWVLRDAACGPDILESLHAAEAPPGGAPSRAQGSAPSPAPQQEAELRMADHTAAHTSHGIDRAASTHLHFALPPRRADTADGPWRLRAFQCAGPSRFRLRTEAFQGAGRPRMSADSFALHQGALTVTSSGGWSRGPS